MSASPTEAGMLQDWRRRAIPFARHPGIDITAMAEGRATLRFAPGPEHLNSFGINHGGALMSLRDMNVARPQTPEGPPR